MNIFRAASRTFSGIFAGDRHVTVQAIPDRDAVPPPQLAADTPILDVLKPVEIRLLKTFRHDSDSPISHRGEGGFCEWFDGYKPLRGDHWLDDFAAALGTRNGRPIRLGFDDQPS